jgi:protein-disulfide isomerase-like protein with CxxC motif
MNSTRPERGVHERRRRRFEAELPKQHTAHDQRIERREGGNFGRRRKAALEAGEDHEDQAE